MARKNHTVLFVDDEQSLLDVVRDALRKEPYEVVTAASASEGLEVLHEREVDVVVSDDLMPRVSGSDFLAFVRQRYPQTIRIMLTGQASLEAAIQAINEGEIYRFLAKPCSHVLLARTLREALLLRSLNCETTRLLATVQEQRKILNGLGRHYPGINELNRTTDGALVLEEHLDAESLLFEMRAEAGLSSAP